MTGLELSADIYIDAPVERVWALVGDVRRMCEWSPQVSSTRLRTGFDTVALGTQFTNRNRSGEVEWTTHAEVVRFESEREIAFRIEGNLGDAATFAASMGDGMRTTLEAIKADAESAD